MEEPTSGNFTGGTINGIELANRYVKEHNHKRTRGRIDADNSTDGFM